MNVLVIALDSAGPMQLPKAQVLVVAPALNSRLKRWLSDEDEARRLAAERALATVERLERRGLTPTAGSVTETRCRRSLTRCRSSPQTRSLSPATPASRSGSPQEPARGSASRSCGERSRFRTPREATR
jgi:hypothetical protein